MFDVVDSVAVREGITLQKHTRWSEQLSPVGLEQMLRAIGVAGGALDLPSLEGAVLTLFQQPAMTDRTFTNYRTWGGLLWLARLRHGRALNHPPQICVPNDSRFSTERNAFKPEFREKLRNRAETTWACEIAEHDFWWLLMACDEYAVGISPSSTDHSNFLHPSILVDPGSVSSAFAGLRLLCTIHREASRGAEFDLASALQQRRRLLQDVH
jgi:hypothetical protein